MSSKIALSPASRTLSHGPFGHGRGPSSVKAIAMLSTTGVNGVGRGSALGYERRRTTRKTLLRRGGRVVDRAALEMRSTRKGTGGSNPSLSAILRPAGSGWQATEELKGGG